MAELIDVACDICGRQYRWPNERLGNVASCRDCGTEFEVAVYVPPDEDSVAANELRWAKNAGVIVLLSFVVIALSSLLVIRPNGEGRLLAHRPQIPTTPVFTPPAGWPQTIPPPAVPTTHPDGRPMSLVEMVDAEAERFRLQHAQRGSFPPPSGEVPPQPDLSTFNIQTNGPSRVVIGGPNTSAPGAVGKSATPGPAMTAPVITGWEIIEHDNRPWVRFTGTGLQGVTRCDLLFANHLKDQKFTPISDTELETDGLFLSKDKVSLFVVTNPLGAAVVFSDNIETISNHRDLGRQNPGLDIFLVARGGHLVSIRPCIVLVDEGGVADVKSWVFVGLVKRGGELRVPNAKEVRAELGATIIPAPADSNSISIPSFTLTRLPPIGR